MKKILSALLLAVTMLVAAPAQAQVKFGMRAGLNLTSMSFDGGTFAKSNRQGFYVGPTVKFTVPIVGLSCDASALYDSRTVELDGVNMGSTSMTAKSIAIPINVRYGIGLSSVVNAFVFAGPQFAFNVGGDKSLYDNVSSWSWKTSNVSVNVGLGATLFKKIEAKVNYNIACGKTGEMTVFDTAGAIIGVQKARYNAWQIGVGYWF